LKTVSIPTEVVVFLVHFLQIIPSGSLEKALVIGGGGGGETVVGVVLVGGGDSSGGSVDNYNVHTDVKPEKIR
jgi:hypothetical protein